MKVITSQIYDFNFGKWYNIITIDYQASGLQGQEIYHGTIPKHILSIKQGIQQGKSTGGGLIACDGLCVALKKNMAEHYAAYQAGRANLEKGVVLEGKIAAKNLRVGRLILASKGIPADIKKGIFPINWGYKFPHLQQVLHENFDVIQMVDIDQNGHYDQFLVFHESAGLKAIKWSNPKLKNAIKKAGIFLRNAGNTISRN
jgi:hypothetical protein